MSSEESGRWSDVPVWGRMFFDFACLKRDPKK
jgi:hypothetical protein